MDRLDFYKNTGHRTYNWSIRLAFVVMVSIGLRGLGEIGWGLLYSMKELFFWHSSDGHSVGSIPAVEVGIGSILDGFEFLLLAPLAFVIVVSIGNYLRALLQYDRVIEAEHQVHRVKGLIISLMISIVATDLVKRFVGQPDLKTDALVFGGTLIILFSVYFILLTGVRRMNAE